MATSLTHPEVPPDAEPRSMDDLVADAEEVARHLAEVPRQTGVLRIPERAVSVVADLDSYGD